MKNDNVDSLWIKLKLNFFAHAKTRFMLKRFGTPGPYCVLAIWAQMMDRGGTFNAENAFDLEGIADAIGGDVAQVLAIIKGAVECELLTPTGTKGVYQKDRILANLELRHGNVKRASTAGMASAAKRSKHGQKPNISNSESTPSQRQVYGASTKKKEREDNITPLSERERGVTDRVMLAESAPLWGRLSAKFNLPHPGDEAIDRIESALNRYPANKNFKKIAGVYENMTEERLQILKAQPVTFVEMLETEFETIQDQEPEEQP